LLAQWARRSPSENAFLLLIPVVGATTGLAALGIAHTIAFLEHHLWGSGQQLLTAVITTPWYWRILVPTAGGAVLGISAALFKLHFQGRGTGEIIQALALKGGAISLRQEWPATVAGIITVGCGGSLGREGPMVEFGVAYSSWLAGAGSRRNNCGSWFAALPPLALPPPITPRLAERFSPWRYSSGILRSKCSGRW
jgi:CIC family chloride channel protein